MIPIMLRIIAKNRRARAVLEAAKTGNQALESEHYALLKKKYVILTRAAKEPHLCPRQPSQT
jgi:hypothetical protein